MKLTSASRSFRLSNGNDEILIPRAALGGSI